MADREFIGSDWFRFLLQQQGLEFIIRIRCEGWVPLANGKKQHLSTLVRTLPKGQTRHYANVRLYNGAKAVRMNLVGHRPLKGDLVLLATNRTELTQILDTYKTRWSIETTFGFLKSKGFQLEDTHLTKPKRIRLLLGILSLCLLWGVLVGVLLQQLTPIKIKKHGRKAISSVTRDHWQHQLPVGNLSSLLPPATVVYIATEVTGS